mgnify:CR=1 FL=1
MIKPRMSAVIEHGETTNRVRVRKRAVSPKALPGYVSPRGNRAPEDDPTVSVCISMRASELAVLDRDARARGIARSKWIVLLATRRAA